MINPLILMVAGAHKATPVEPGLDPNPLEPYRVLWNPDAQSAKPEDYVHDIPGSIAVLVDAYAVLSDHAPLPDKPTMVVHESSGMQDIAGGGSEIYAPSNASRNPPMRVINIADIAYPRRSGKEPKIFAIRVDNTLTYQNVSLIRYNLDATGTKWIALRAGRSSTSMTVQAVYCFGGEEFGGEMFHSESGALDDMLRLVIYDNRVEVRYGEPGTLASSVVMPVPPKPQTGAYLGLFHATDAQYPKVGTLGLRYLAIYDGSF